MPCGEHSRQAECSTRAGDRGFKDTICETRLFQQLGEILPREMGPELSGSSGGSGHFSMYNIVLLVFLDRFTIVKVHNTGLSFLPVAV